MTPPHTAFIVDLSCNAQWGHVPASMDVFGEFLADAGYKVTCVLPRGSEGVQLYSDALVLRDAPAPYGPGGEGLGFQLPPWVRWLTAAKVLGGPTVVAAHYERIVEKGYWLRRMVAEIATYFSRLFKSKSVGPDDIVVMPSADLCTTLGLLKAAQVLGPRAPRLALRFISVLENVGPLGSRSARWIWSAIQRSRMRGVRIECGFETDRYRKTLPEAVATSGRLVPYPPSRRAKKTASSADLLSDGKLVIGVLGTARPEKGFEKLPGLSSRAQERFGESVRFMVQQAAQPWGEGYAQVLAKLTASDNVSLLPGRLQINDLARAIENCDALLLPYSSRIYALRGSAMVSDACDHAMPCIAENGTAFAEELQREGIGLTYDTGEQFESLCQNLLAPGVRLNYSEKIAIYNQKRRQAVSEWLGLPTAVVSIAAS